MAERVVYSGQLIRITMRPAKLHPDTKGRRESSRNDGVRADLWQFNYSPQPWRLNRVRIGAFFASLKCVRSFFQNREAESLVSHSGQLRGNCCVIGKPAFRRILLPMRARDCRASNH
jgi:hypothetical protein